VRSGIKRAAHECTVCLIRLVPSVHRSKHLVYHNPHMVELIVCAVWGTMAGVSQVAKDEDEDAIDG